MSAPLSQIFRGDFLVEPANDTTNFGLGNVTFPNTLYVNGTTNSTGTGTGSIITTGGLAVGQASFLTGNLNALSISNLNTTNINTTLGATTVTGLNGVNISVGSASTFITTSGSLSLSSNTGNLIMSGGASGFTAVSISATNAAGSIQLNGGTSGTGNIIMNTGSGGITATTGSGGPITQTAIGASFQNIVTSIAPAQNLSLLLNGAFDSGIILQSAGVNTSQTAIAIKTTALGGNIVLNNSTSVSSTGSITLQSGGGGISLSAGTSTLTGAFNINGYYSASNITLNTTAVSQNLTLGLSGASDSSLILQSSGTNATNTAVILRSTSTAGTIAISNAAGTGSINLSAGSGGISGTTQSGGAINLTSTGAPTTISNTGDFPISINAPSGTANSIINIQSSSTNTSAININAPSGGFALNVFKPISIQTSDTATGINIGTLYSNPVQIGGTTSLTTINGNLNVKGTTTTIQSTVIQIADNTIQLNSSPSMAEDSGVSVKRFQSANNTSLGETITDSPTETGTARGGTTTSITLSASAVGTAANYYNGWWVLITSGTGSGQVRSIKSFAGSGTGVATIYSTADQTGVLGNPTPVVGLNYTTTPDATSVYSLFSTEFTTVAWDSTAKEWCVEYSALAPLYLSNIARTSYANFHCNNIRANAITANSINGVATDTLITVTLTNNTNTPTTISGFPSTYGTFIVLVKPDAANPGLSYALFVAGRGNNALAGTTNRLISIKGPNQEQLDMTWPASANPQLFFRSSPNNNALTVVYNLRVISYF